LTSSSTLVVSTTGPTGSTPKGLAIDIFFNFSGGRCWTRQQHPKRPTINVFKNFGGGCYRTYRQHPKG
jgi:hypothetical protein